MKKAIPWVVGAATVSWLSWLFVWPLGLAIAVPLVAMAGQKGRKAALATAGLTPFVLVPVFGFLTGMVDYMRGTASLVYPGVITAESNNLHASYRVPMAQTGRPDDGRSALYRVPRNAAVHAMGSVFGPPSKSYRGQYPAREAAWNLLDQARSASLVGNNQLMLYESYRIVPIGPLAAELARRPGRSLRATLAGETLVVGVPNELWLVDTTRGQPFTHWIRKELRTFWPGEGAPVVAETEAAAEAEIEAEAASEGP